MFIGQVCVLLTLVYTQKQEYLEYLVADRDGKLPTSAEVVDISQKLLISAKTEP